MIYDDERRRADSLPHRKHDLEALAIKLQLGAQRDAVWRILDEYRAALPEVGAQTEEDRLWRLALHRMDMRTYQPKLMEAEVGEDTSNGDSATAGADEDRQRQGCISCPARLMTTCRKWLIAMRPSRLASKPTWRYSIGAWRRGGAMAVTG